MEHRCCMELVWSIDVACTYCWESFPVIDDNSVIKSKSRNEIMQLKCEISPFFLRKQSYQVSAVAKAKKQSLLRY